MKKIILLFGPILFLQNVFGQTFLIDFESPNPAVSIDTTPGNLWQIATPQKSFINSVYNKVIITDSVNFYPPNNQSSFILKIPASYITGGTLLISLSYIIDTDTLRDGGTIDYSVDGGVDWYQGNNFDFGQIFPDMLYDGSFGLSGRSDWTSLSFFACNIWSSNNDSLWLRFTFKSDSINNQRDGWAIDDISVQYIDCGGVQEINTNYHFSSVFPNPVSNTSLLQIKSQNSFIRRVDFYDALGRRVSSPDHPHQNNIPISKEKFGEGIFFYHVELANHERDSGTFVVQ